MTVDREGLGKSLTGTRQVTRQSSKRDNVHSRFMLAAFQAAEFFFKVGDGVD